MRMKLRRVRLGIAAMGLVIATSTDASNSIQAAQHKGHAARHHALAYAAPEDLLRKAAPYAGARRAEGLSFGRRLFPANGAPGLVGSAGMSAAPKDFGPHFDFPAASLNDGPTEAPYPGW
jgi:hypothetical protein